MPSTIARLIIMWFCASAMLYVAFPTARLMGPDIIDRFVTISAVGNTTQVDISQNASSLVKSGTVGISTQAGIVGIGVIAWEFVSFAVNAVTMPIGALVAVGAPWEVTFLVGATFSMLMIFAIVDWLRSGR